MLPGARPGGLSSIVWGLRGSVVSWANRSIGVLTCPTPPGPTVPPCAAPSRPNRGISGFWIRQIIIIIIMIIIIELVLNVSISCMPLRASVRSKGGRVKKEGGGLQGWPLSHEGYILFSYFQICFIGLRYCQTFLG